MISFLKNRDISYLESELLLNNHIKLMPASYYDNVLRDDLMMFCHKHARSLLVTQELVEAIKEIIKGLNVIEIGAGAGDLGFHLNITMTDSKIQDVPYVKEQYKLMNQPTVIYPPYVEKLTANEAVLKYVPDMVIGSWITEWIDPLLPPPPHGGSIYGVKENDILKTSSYMLIGNIKIHGKKEILKRPHETHWLPFIKSRIASGNRIWMWQWKSAEIGP